MNIHIREGTFPQAGCNQVCDRFYLLLSVCVISSERISRRLSAMFSLDADLRARKRVPDVAASLSRSVSRRRFS